MAFCTTCGATVNGTFCTQCGTPVSAAAQGAPQASPPPPPPPNMSYQAAPPAPVGPPPAMAGRGTSPIIWVLVIVLGLFVLGGLAVVGTGIFFVHKARQAGLDPELMSRKPGLAITKMMAAMNPDVEVLNTDDGAGKITVRDRKTGKVTTLNFDDVRNGKMSITAQDENGKTATMEFGGSAGNLPSWIPAYPGSHPQATMSARAAGGDGGNFTFTTSDSPAQVLQYYQDQIKSMGLKVTSVMSSSNGGMVNGSDDGNQRTLNVIVGTGSGGTTVAVTYGSK
jgi:hypothetical protein